MNKRKFERDPDDKIISGVCGGLARYFGISSRLIRFLFFISVFFSFSLTFWVYILFWLIAPMRRSTREKLSRDMRKKARNLDKLVEDTCARSKLPELTSRLNNIHDIIESLLPELESRSLSREPGLLPVFEAAFVHLPELLENFLRLPANYAQGQAITGIKTAQDHLSDELQQLERTLVNVTKGRYGQKFAKSADALDGFSTRYEDDPTTPFRLKLESLQSRVAGRLDAEATAKIENIKNSLLAALGRLMQTVDGSDVNLYNVRQIALEYLPNTVDKYLALPQGLADNEPLSQGKTAQAAFHEQLNVLDGALTRMVTSLYQEDAQGLFVHGHFLRDKFIDGQLEWMGDGKP
ncbi:MAG: PspC domain-containing protein [Proteobacteria bacterium]|nr:PspC domain-containing protein [Pseudomonadota bacterium]